MEKYLKQTLLREIRYFNWLDNLGRGIVLLVTIGLFLNVVVLNLVDAGGLLWTPSPVNLANFRLAAIMTGGAVLPGLIAPALVGMMAAALTVRAVRMGDFDLIAVTTLPDSFIVQSYMQSIVRRIRPLVYALIAGGLVFALNVCIAAYASFAYFYGSSLSILFCTIMPLIGMPVFAWYQKWRHFYGMFIAGFAAGLAIMFMILFVEYGTTASTEERQAALVWMLLGLFLAGVFYNGLLMLAVALGVYLGFRLRDMGLAVPGVLFALYMIVLLSAGGVGWMAAELRSFFALVLLCLWWFVPLPLILTTLILRQAGRYVRGGG